MATIKDIARIAGVSPSTVSFVLNGKARKMKVSATTEKRIIKIVNELGYTPNASARKLRSSEADRPILAIYWPHDHRTRYLGRVINEMREELNKRNMDYELVVKTYAEGHLCDDKCLLNRNYYNIAVIGGITPVDLNKLRSINTPLPIILYNRNVDDYHCVYCEYDAITSQITSSLSPLGTQKVVFLSDSSHHFAGNYRMQHMIDTFREYHVIDSDSVIIETEDSCSGGAISASKILAMNPMPTLAVCATDMIAFGCLSSLQKNGVKVPDDIKIFGFGLADPQLAEYAIPSLSIIELPTDQLASGLLQIVSDLTEHSSTKPIKYRFDPVVHIRESFSF